MQTFIFLFPVISYAREPVSQALILTLSVGEMVQPDLNRFKPDLPLFLLQKWFWIFISNNKKKNLKSFH